jgi:hypothetical protein
MPGSAIPLTPMLIALGAYLALQLLQNLILMLYLSRAKRTAKHMLAGTFWAGVVNALYFITAAVVLHITGYAPNYPPHDNYWLLAGLGLVLGPLLWYVCTLGRKLGLALFGKSELIAAEDAVLRAPPEVRYIGWGIINLWLLQPLGRELFLRGAFFPAVLTAFGWPWAIAATLVVELLLRLNIVWLFQTLIYALFMCALYLLTHCALSGFVAASVAGLIQAVVLLRLGAAHVRTQE